MGPGKRERIGPTFYFKKKVAGDKGWGGQTRIEGKARWKGGNEQWQIFDYRSRGESLSMGVEENQADRTGKSLS